jgi:hypothetical protein
VHFLVLARAAALVLAFTTALHVGLFGWIEATARCLDERQRAELLIYLFIAAMYTLAAVAALHGLISWVDLPG